MDMTQSVVVTEHSQIEVLLTHRPPAGRDVHAPALPRAHPGAHPRRMAALRPGAPRESPDPRRVPGPPRLPLRLRACLARATCRDPTGGAGGRGVLLLSWPRRRPEAG